MQTALSFEAGGRNITKVRIVKTGTLKEQTKADTTLADLMQTEVHTYVGEDADGKDIERPLGSFESAPICSPERKARTLTMQKV